jgi:ABC-2 type transport system permease protein
MSKIGLIISREYNSRVKKKSFIIMTFLGPLLMAALIVIPVIFATIKDDSVKKIAVIDPAGKFKSTFDKLKSYQFDYLNNTTVDEVKKDFDKKDYYAVLYYTDTAKLSTHNIFLSSNKQPNINVKVAISQAIEKQIHNEKLTNAGISAEVLQSLKTNVDIETTKWTKEGKDEKSSTELSMGIGYFAAIMIYMFVFIYGAQVMRGVIEEKTNRIVEIIISSVKPFELMMGKIVGVALVVLTQLALWIVLTTAIISVTNSIMFSGKSTKSIEQVQSVVPQNSIPQVAQGNDMDANGVYKFLAENLKGIPVLTLVISFFFYFIGGYLLYSSLFAAIGAAVDNEADTQQFMLPISLPLIIGFIVAQVIVQNPESQIAFWFSIIPFTSPVVMMVRLAFGVPAWELALSITLLILTFIGTTWMAGKIYRTGILMYGKKINYRELWKWIRYNNA